MAGTFDDALDDFVKALLERRFFSLGRISQRTGVSRDEVPRYLDQMVAAGRLSPQERAEALQNLTDWKRWGRRNAMFIIPLGLIFLVYQIVEHVHHGLAAAVVVPLLAGIGGTAVVQVRYRQRRASRRDSSSG